MLNWYFYGGRGNDIVYSPSYEDAIYGFYGQMDGEDGDDILYGPHKIASSDSIDGGEGNDKIIGGDDNYGQYFYGEGGDDIIYGGDNTGTDVPYYQWLHGDLNSLYGYAYEDYYPGLGGNDQIWAGNGTSYELWVTGGPYDDKIWSGNDHTGDIIIYGDNQQRLGF